jgi:histone H3/H4
MALKKTPAKKELPKMIVDSRVKDYVKEADLRSSSDFVDALNAHVVATIEEAKRRCQDNGRATLRPSDL